MAAVAVKAAQFAAQNPQATMWILKWGANNTDTVARWLKMDPEYARQFVAALKALYAHSKQSQGGKTRRRRGGVTESELRRRTPKILPAAEGEGMGFASLPEYLSAKERKAELQELRKKGLVGYRVSQPSSPEISRPGSPMEGMARRRRTRRRRSTRRS